MNSEEPYSISLRRSFGILFAVGLTLSLCLTAIGYTADRHIFRPDPYVDALDRYDFPQLFPRLLAEMIVRSQPPGDPAAAPPGQITNSASQIKYLNADDYEMILRGLFPPDWVDAQTRMVLRQLFDFLNLRSSRLRLVVSLTEVKSRLSGEQGSAIAQRIIQSWPQCTPEWLAGVAQQALTGRLEDFPTCQPPSEYVTLVQPVVVDSLSSLANSLPDQVDLVRVMSLARSGNFRFDQIPPAQESGGLWLPISYQFFRWVIRLSPLITLWLLVMVAVTVVRRTQDLLLWFGVPFLVSGILTLLFSLSGGMPLYSSIARRMTAQASSAVSANMAQVLALAIESVVQRYVLWVAIESGLLILLGAAMVFAGIMLRRRVR